MPEQRVLKTLSDRIARGVPGHLYSVRMENGIPAIYYRPDISRRLLGRLKSLVAFEMPLSLVDIKPMVF